MSERQAGTGEATEQAAAVSGVEGEPAPDSPLFHFALPADWEAAQSRGAYQTASFGQEGFIHCATEAQLAGVIERHLRGRGPRVRLQLDPRALRDQLKWEWSTASHDLYPHLFAPIPLDAVREASDFDPDLDRS